MGPAVMQHAPAPLTLHWKDARFRTRSAFHILKATAFEFRFRFWILVAIFALGFTAPWDRALHLDGTGPNTHVWGQLAVALSRAGVNITAAFNVVLAVGIVFAFAGAALRTWATANLGPEVMRGEALRGGSVSTSVEGAEHLADAEHEGNPPFAARRMGHPELVVEGPYRFVRNPLYLGLWMSAMALALLMPPSGAIVTLVLLIRFQLRLMLAEEAHLTAQLGQAYADYCARVPRIMPALRAKIAGSSEHPQWGRAALAEIFLWGTAISFAAVGWQYNAHLLIQCVLVSLGLALVVMGTGMPAKAEAR
jgi:hypothetical protein